MTQTMPDEKSEKPANFSTRLLKRPEFTVGIFLIALLLYKFKLMRPAARGPRLLFAIVQHDVAIVALMLLLYAAASALAKWKKDDGKARVFTAVLSRLCMASCLLVALVYVADALVYEFFVTRLYIGDIVTFSAEPRAALSLLRTGSRVVIHRQPWKLAIGCVLIALLFRACYLLLARPVRSPLRGQYLVLVAALLVLLSVTPLPGYVYSFYDHALYQNFIERNENFFAHTNFSDAFRENILAMPPVEVCAPGRGRRLNVILLVVESLSAYDSRYFSGIEDWTPRLDEIAQRETSLPNFYANGWTTIGGLVSLLGRSFPFIPEHTAFNPFGSPRLADFQDAQRTLPRVLSAQGYITEFIAAGDTAFIGQDKWLKSVGFQKAVTGNDSRFDAQKVRGPFNSIPDRVLYDAALEEMHQIPANKPYFMVVQTYWSHRPFTDQNGGRLDGEGPVIREVDAQIGAFYEQLMAARFFQNGILFITGDHRAPEQFRKSEFQRFGASAAARIPAVIVTRAISLPRVLPQDFQQRDFSASIEALIGDKYCLGPQEGAFLSDPIAPPSCVMQAHGDDRDLIYVKCGTAEGTVRAAGDATRFVAGAVPDEASIIQTVNRTRARRAQ